MRGGLLPSRPAGQKTRHVERHWRLASRPGGGGGGGDGDGGLGWCDRGGDGEGAAVQGGRQRARAGGVEEHVARRAVGCVDRVHAVRGAGRDGEAAVERGGGEAGGLEAGGEAEEGGDEGDGYTHLGCGWLLYGLDWYLGTVDTKLSRNGRGWERSF
ncbi:hypothetical protein GGTG_11959 [Gaeumannomyces tritici R3-111a-1]|uniref:Uncharacterized protein n=1 Tax=Gaeumannomyces tritici (strain R3-111a-1) TaxID=644352 RepID=J3PEM8_GAET3|nr:hypothetical protein GGTG_11959 [Gaeumannomyces tritici R3-111a-1]EJT70936.1 hypothetical protein GGTG_11959 [Gaeumannomyces tritici R3-111a-1]